MTFQTDGGIGWEDDDTNFIITVRPASVPEEGYAKRNYIAASSDTIHVKVSGDRKSGKPFVKASGTRKEGKAYVKRDGEWKLGE